MSLTPKLGKKGRYVKVSASNPGQVTDHQNHFVIASEAKQSRTMMLWRDEIASSLRSSQ